MATIGTETIIFEGKHFRKALRCNRDGLFRISYPKPVVARLGEPKEAVAETAKEAERVWKARMKEYTAAQTSKRKVIRYQVELVTRTWDAVAPGHEGCELQRDDLTFAVGLAVSVWADVYEEEKVDLGEAGFRFNYDRVDNALPMSIRNNGHFGVDRQSNSKLRCMEWTPEREAFFHRISELMEGLAFKLDEMTKDSEEFAALAQLSSTSRLLPE